MRRITSIKNAIQYFEQGTRVEVRKNSKGEEYKVHIPPTGFHSLRLTTNCNGFHITKCCESWQWKDYAGMIRKHYLKGDIVKVVVRYDA